MFKLYKILEIFVIFLARQVAWQRMWWLVVIVRNVWYLKYQLCRQGELKLSLRQHWPCPALHCSHTCWQAGGKETEGGRVVSGWTLWHVVTDLIPRTSPHCALWPAGSRQELKADLDWSCSEQYHVWCGLLHAGELSLSLSLSRYALPSFTMVLNISFFSIL